MLQKVTIFKKEIKFAKMFVLQIEYRLNPGEVMCFNNRRMLHGRNGFTSSNGSRHFQGCYINTDEFKSKLRALIVNANGGGNKIESNFLDLRNIKLEKMTLGNNDYE